jgi:hypothetical protein
MTEHVISDETIMHRLRNVVIGFMVFTAVLAIMVTIVA